MEGSQILRQGSAQAWTGRHTQSRNRPSPGRNPSLGVMTEFGPDDTTDRSRGGLFLIRTGTGVPSLSSPGVCRQPRADTIIRDMASMVPAQGPMWMYHASATRIQHRPHPRLPGPIGIIGDGGTSIRRWPTGTEHMHRRRLAWERAGLWKIIYTFDAHAGVAPAGLVGEAADASDVAMKPIARNGRAAMFTDARSLRWTAARFRTGIRVGLREQETRSQNRNRIETTAVRSDGETVEPDEMTDRSTGHPSWSADSSERSPCFLLFPFPAPALCL